MIGLERIPHMPQTNFSKTTPKSTTSPKNGSPSEDHTGEQPSASTTTAGPSTPTAPTATDKKPITVLVSESLHRKVKVLAELSGTSLSELVEEQLRVVVKERLPGLLAKLDTDS